MDRLQPLRELKPAQEMPSGAKARRSSVIYVRAEARTLQKASSHVRSEAKKGEKGISWTAVHERNEFRHGSVGIRDSMKMRLRE
jgi:hypothetical protein